MLNVKMCASTLMNVILAHKSIDLPEFKKVCVSVFYLLFFLFSVYQQETEFLEYLDAQQVTWTSNNIPKVKLLAVGLKDIFPAGGLGVAFFATGPGWGL